MDQSIDAAAAAGPVPSLGGKKKKFDGKDALAVAMAEQFSTCHAHVSRWFAMADDDEEYEFAARMDALKLAARLVQASAAAARAVTQIKGGVFHHQITVTRVDYPAEKAAQKAREKKAKAKALSSDTEAGKALDAKINRILGFSPRRTPEQEAASVPDDSDEDSA